MDEAEGLPRALAEQLESLRRGIATKESKPAASPEPQSRTTPTLVQLPLWPETRRAAPNAIFRSALFPALKFKQGRPVLKNHLLASVGGVTVYFTGERFDQSDLDVYLEILNYARLHPLGTECTFAAYGLLKSLGHATGNANHKWLHSVLVRLRGGTIDIADQRKRYFGGLIEGGFKDELTRHYRITINPHFANLFGFGMWASIDRTQRRALGRNATAKALHAYYSTHAAPSAHSFETLAALVGLNNPNRRQQRATLLKAHATLADAKIGFLRGYAVAPGGLTIRAHVSPTRTQARHLARKSIRSASKAT
jgi:hypothetical protein